MKVFVRTASILIAACVFLAAGCAGLGGRQAQVRASLVDITIREVRPLETIFLASIRFLNSGDNSLVIEGVDCDLYLNGRHFASGLTGSGMTVPPYGSAVIAVPVYSSTLGMVSTVTDLIRRAEGGRAPAKPLSYELKGYIRGSGGGWRRGRIPFQTKGELFLPGS